MSVVRSTSGEVLFEDSSDTLQQALENAAAAGADLSGADLSYVDLSGFDAEHLKISKADLTGANLDGARFARCDLSGARLAGASLRGFKATSTDFTEARTRRRRDAPRAGDDGADFTGASLSDCWLSRANFFGSRMTGTAFADCAMIAVQMGECAFDGATIENCDLHGASLGKTTFARSLINGSDLSNGHMRGADFTGAHVTATRFSNSDMRQSRLDAGTFVRCDMDDCVLGKAEIRHARFLGCDFTGVRARGATVASNCYEQPIDPDARKRIGMIEDRTHRSERFADVRMRSTNLPPEMLSDELATSTVRIGAKVASWGAVLGAGALAASQVPKEAQDLVTNVLKAGTVGLAVSASMTMAFRMLGPHLHEHVIKRVEGVMAKAAPSVSSMASRAPTANAIHAVKDMHFTWTTGLSEKRVKRIVAKAQKADAKGDSEHRAAGALFGGGDHVIVARDAESLERIQQLVQESDRRVLAVRLREDGKPRENGPAVYAFNPDGSSSAIWYHKGEPDFATAFTDKGEPAAHRVFSARARLIASDEALPTKILSRRETTARQALSWLSPEDDALGRATAGRSLELAISLREAREYLKSSTRYLGRADKELRQVALGAASALERVGAEKGEKAAPETYRNRLDKTRDALGKVFGRMEEQELGSFAKLGRTIDERLSSLQTELSEAAPRKARASGSEIGA